jgi:two-component SAPR family response regulator
MDGNPIKFARSKSKELLAILVSKRGSSCTIKELTSILFENAADDDKKKDYTQQLISTLIKTLRGLGIEKVIDKSYNSISVNVDYLDCDYYKFDNKNPDSLDGYKGEFMAQYSWAEYVTGYLDSIVRKRG